MKLSKNGYLEILDYESVCLSAYLDSANVWTIGAGHTKPAGPPIPTKELKITIQEAIDIFKQDMKKYEKEVTNALKLEVTQYQFDALVSWHFNTGAIADSTLTKLINGGRSSLGYIGEELKKWNKVTVNGKKVVSAGLNNRREKEENLYINNKYSNTGRVVIFPIDKNSKPLYHDGYMVDVKKYF